MHRTLLFLFLFGFFFNGIGQLTSAFNNRTVEIEPDTDYSFIISGHFYGNGSNTSGYPVNSILANVPWINQSNAQMLVCLGDLFRDIGHDIPGYKRSFFGQLEIPLINAVGNHDLTGNIYQENFGSTFFQFQLSSDLHVVLDTEVDDGNISDEQLQMLKDLSNRVSQGDINNVFVYSHRTIWSGAYQQMDGLFTDNTQSLMGTNYEQDVLPIFKAIAEKSSLYVFSGSLGPAPASFFYFDDEENGFEIIATAIRGLERDALLIVDVKDGEVLFNLHSLTGEELLDLESYDVEFWKERVGVKPFNWRLVPLYFKNMLTHRYFWYGCLYAFTVGLIIFFYLRKRKNRKKLSTTN